MDRDEPGFEDVRGMDVSASRGMHVEHLRN
jgi:hypothetical protein